MDHLQYSVTTNTQRIIEAVWTGRCIRIAVLHAHWSDVEIWWEYSVEEAATRFQALVAMNTRKPAIKRTVALEGIRS